MRWESVAVSADVADQLHHPAELGSSVESSGDRCPQGIAERRQQQEAEGIGMIERYECKLAPAIFCKTEDEQKFANLRVLANRLSWDKKTRWISEKILEILE